MERRLLYCIDDMNASQVESCELGRGSASLPSSAEVDTERDGGLIQGGGVPFMSPLLSEETRWAGLGRSIESQAQEEGDIYNSLGVQDPVT